MKCINIFGHKWGKWEQHTCAPKKEDNGELYAQFLQSRLCEKCNYEVIKWLPKAQKIKQD